MATNQTFKLPVISGRTFTHETVRLDGTRFENCKFINCTISYLGGPAEMSSCEISPNTLWDFRDAAATTVMVLQQCGWRIEYGTGPNAAPIPIPRA